MLNFTGWQAWVPVRFQEWDGKIYYTQKVGWHKSLQHFFVFLSIKVGRQKRLRGKSGTAFAVPV